MYIFHHQFCLHFHQSNHSKWDCVGITLNYISCVLRKHVLTFENIQYFVVFYLSRVYGTRNCYHFPMINQVPGFETREIEMHFWVDLQFIYFLPSFSIQTRVCDAFLKDLPSKRFKPKRTHSVNLRLIENLF